jgi:hypothetical protein
MITFETAEAISHLSANLKRLWKIRETMMASNVHCKIGVFDSKDSYMTIGTDANTEHEFTKEAYDFKESIRKACDEKIEDIVGRFHSIFYQDPSEIFVPGTAFSVLAEEFDKGGTQTQQVFTEMIKEEVFKQIKIFFDLEKMKTPISDYHRERIAENTANSFIYGFIQRFKPE